MKILDRLPISEERTSVRFGERYVTLLPDQILVWVSIHLAGVSQPEANIPQIPACSTAATISASQSSIATCGSGPASIQRPCDCLATSRSMVGRCRDMRPPIWLYRNVPGTRNIASGQPPFRLRMPRGIAVYPPDAVPPGPRLPLLGLPAILNNDLDWWTDPDAAKSPCRRGPGAGA